MSAAWALIDGAPWFFTLRQPGPWNATQTIRPEHVMGFRAVEIEGEHY
jgi:hypothetical protein